MNNTIVKKPWGYEYLAYENDDVGVWILHIDPFQSTSMHCHTSKTTGLIVLDGKILLSFLGDSVELNKLDKRMIRRGLFHSSKSISTQETVLLEIETPKNKEDLVRLKDEYGRKLQPYETEVSSPEEKNIIKFNEPTNSSNLNSYTFANCIINIEHVTNIDSILNKNDNDLLVFLKGGIKTLTNQRVVLPGDVGYAHIVKKVGEHIPIIEQNTLILSIKKL